MILLPEYIKDIDYSKCYFQHGHEYLIIDPTLTHQLLTEYASKLSKGDRYYQQVHRDLGTGLLTISHHQDWEEMHECFKTFFSRRAIMEWKLEAQIIDFLQAHQDQPLPLFSTWMQLFISLTLTWLTGKPDGISTTRVQQWSNACNAYYQSRHFGEALWLKLQARWYRRMLLHELKTVQPTPKSLMGKYLTLYQALNFLITGIESTTTLLGFALLMLEKHPEYCPLLERAEISSECWLQETLRCYPSVWLFSRQLMEPIPEWKLPQYATLTFCPSVQHHHPQYWQEPNRFFPERFQSKIIRGSYLPFGLGPRSCIGQVLAQYLSQSAFECLSQHYEVIWAAPESLKPQKAMFLRWQGNEMGMWKHKADC